MALRARNGKWHYRFKVDGLEYSGPTDLAATKRNESAASAKEQEHRRAIKEGRTYRRGLTARRFSDAGAEYLDWCRTEHRDRASTARRIAVSFTSLRAQFDALMVAAVGPAEIEAYKVVRVQQDRVADVTLRHDLHALSGFFQWAMRLGYAAENPVRAVRIPSDKDAVRIHVLSAEEERRYFAAAARDQELHDFGRLLIQQGCRPADLFGLAVGAVDLGGGTVMVASKTSAGRRTLTLTTESRSILARRCSGLAPQARVFACTPDSIAKRHVRVYAASSKRVRGEKIPAVGFVLYDLRHTFATRMAQAGCDLATLAAILGHSSIAIVQRYIHISAKHQEEAMRKFESALNPNAEEAAIQ